MMALIVALILNTSNVNIDDFRVFDNKTTNVYEISCLNAREINKRLVGTFLEGTGDVMFLIEQEKGINFRTVYAIAGLESGKGKILSGKYNQEKRDEKEKDLTKAGINLLKLEKIIKDKER